MATTADPASAYVPTAERPQPSPRWVVAAGVALIVGLALVIYFPALRGEFLLDDDLYLTGNRLIVAPDGWYRFWLTTEPVDYYPVMYTTLWLEWRLWGMNPLGYHLTNVTLHVAAALLIWAILWQLSIPGACLAALLFTIHPINVESVAWLAQRKNVLTMFFFLLSILFYLRTDQGKDDAGKMVRGQNHFAFWYCLSLFVFGLSMLSKASAAILPVVILGLIWWRRRRISLADMLAMIPFFLVGGVVAAMNVWCQARAFPGGIRTADFAERLAGAGAVVWFYLSKALAPIELIFVYPPWQIDTASCLWWLPFAAAACVSFLLLWRMRTSQAKWGRAVLFAWGFFCVALVPVMGFTDVGFMQHSLVADHYQHFALIGVAALVAAAWIQWHQSANQPIRLAARITLVATISTLVLLARRESRLYSSPITLYESTLAKNPDCSLIRHELGAVFLERGQVSEAISQLEQVQRARPNFALVHLHLGRAKLRVGQPQEAIRQFQQAVQLKPDDAQSRNELGQVLEQAGRVQEAAEQYLQAVQLMKSEPTAEIQNRLGNVLMTINRPQQAIEHLQAAAQLQPSVGGYANLTRAYAELHRPDEAIASAEKALELARSTGQSQMTEQLNDWLIKYRAEQSKSALPAGTAPTGP